MVTNSIVAIILVFTAYQVCVCTTNMYYAKSDFKKMNAYIKASTDWSLTRT